VEPTELYQKQRQCVLDGDASLAAALARDAISSGVDLQACIDRGYAAGIGDVGRLFEEGELFLPELVQGAEAMKAAMDVLRPELLRRIGRDRDGAAGPTVVIGTVQGDIHDIGKLLVATLLEAHGFRVVDLGRDVADARFVEAVEQELARPGAGAPLLALSALLTTTMPGQARVIALLRERGLRDRARVLVGGAPVTRAYAEEIGADGYGPSAVEAVAEARRLAGVAP
jgi:corrinoid protein of di/trimethylamine methyltransferase